MDSFDSRPLSATRGDISTVLLFLFFAPWWHGLTIQLHHPEKSTALVIAQGWTILHSFRCVLLLLLLALTQNRKLLLELLPGGFSFRLSAIAYRRVPRWWWTVVLLSRGTGKSLYVFIAKQDFSVSSLLNLPVPLLGETASAAGGAGWPRNSCWFMTGQDRSRQNLRLGRPQWSRASLPVKE